MLCPNLMTGHVQRRYYTLTHRIRTIETLSTKSSLLNKVTVKIKKRCQMLSSLGQKKKKNNQTNNVHLASTTHISPTLHFFCCKIRIAELNYWLFATVCGLNIILVFVALTLYWCWELRKTANSLVSRLQKLQSQKMLSKDQGFVQFWLCFVWVDFGHIFLAQSLVLIRKNLHQL